MAYIEFPDWKPDLGVIQSGALVVATGVLPLAAGYGPWKQFVPYSAPLPAPPLGGFISRRATGERHVWVGTTDKIYRLNRVTLGWDVMGTGYSASPFARWNFLQFGSSVIAHQVNDPPQVIDVEIGASFAPLGGSPPLMRYGAIVKDFVVLGNEGDEPTKIHWSGSNSIDHWTPLQDQSDLQIFPEGGEVTGVLGGETGFVFQETAVRRLTYVGPPLVFEINKIADKRGCVAPFSIVRAGDTAFYLSPEGFASISIQGESRLIDLGAWNEFFAADADIAYINRTRGVVDPWRSRVYWLYRSINCHQHYDTILCWDYGINKATLARVTLAEAIQAATAGITLDTMDHLGPIDLMDVSFDDDSVKADIPQFAAFNCYGATPYQLGFFSGSNQEAILELSDIEFSPGRRTFVSGLRPRVDAPVSWMSMRTKALPNSARLFSGETMPEISTGICPFRVESRYFGVRLRIPRNEIWTRATGFEPFVTKAGHR